MKIGIDNFRNFKAQNFAFSRVNILIGENSSGKSSLLKFLLALKQTLNDKTINLRLSGRYVDLGNFEDVIYQHKLDERITFSFEDHEEYNDFYFKFMTDGMEDEEERKVVEYGIRQILRNGIIHPMSIEFSMDKNLKSHQTIEIKFSNIGLGKLVLTHNPEKSEGSLEKIMDNPTCNLIYMSEDREYHLNEIKYEPEGFTSIVVRGSLKAQCEEVFDDQAGFFKLSYFLVMQNYVRFFLQKIHFVNPLKADPKRFHAIRDPEPSPSINIDQIVNFLAGENEPSKYFMNKMTEALNDLNVAESIKLVEEDKISVAQLSVKIKNTWSNIIDVGYGVALQIPLIFQNIASNLRGGEILLVEQPEVHLHPKLQANLIETLLKQGESSTFFIETHSEHIVRKLQSLIKNGKYGLKSDNVTVHYFRGDNDKFNISSHVIDERGKLHPNFPSGFFDNSYHLAKELL